MALGAIDLLAQQLLNPGVVVQSPTTFGGLTPTPSFVDQFRRGQEETATRQRQASPDIFDILSTLPQNPAFQSFSPNLDLSQFIPGGGFKAPEVAPIDLSQIGLRGPSQLPTVSDIYTRAGQAVQGLPGLTSAVPFIQQTAQTQREALQQALAPLFEQRQEQLGEAIASRGLVGAGPEQELFRREASAQARELGIGIAGINAQELQQLAQETQSVRAIQESRFNNALNISTELGVSQAELESRFNQELNEMSFNEAQAQRNLRISSEFQTQANNLAAAGRNLEARQLQLEAVKLNNSSTWNQFLADMDKAQIKLEGSGQLRENDKLALDELRTYLDTQLGILQTPGLNDEQVSEILNNINSAMGGAFEFLPEEVSREISINATTQFSSPNVITPEMFSSQGLRPDILTQVAEGETLNIGGKNYRRRGSGLFEV